MNTYYTDCVDSTENVETIINELKAKGCAHHHTALAAGYVRKEHVLIRRYKGRFGRGYAIMEYNPNSTRYCYISYYTIK